MQWIPEAVRIAAERCSPDDFNSVSRILGLWRTRHVFPADDCDHFHRVLMSTPRGTGTAPGASPAYSPHAHGRGTSPNSSSSSVTMTATATTGRMPPPSHHGGGRSSPLPRGGSSTTSSSRPPRLYMPKLTDADDNKELVRAFGPAVEVPDANERISSASLESVLDDVLFRAQVTERLGREASGIPDSVVAHSFDIHSVPVDHWEFLDQELHRNEVLLRHLLLCAEENRAMMAPTKQRLDRSLREQQRKRDAAKRQLRELDALEETILRKKSEAQAKGTKLVVRATDDKAASPVAPSPTGGSRSATAGAETAFFGGNGHELSSDGHVRASVFTAGDPDADSLDGNDDEDDAILDLAPANKRRRTGDESGKWGDTPFVFDPNNPHAGKEMVWHPILRKNVPRDELVEDEAWRD